MMPSQMKSDVNAFKRAEQFIHQIMSETAAQTQGSMAEAIFNLAAIGASLHQNLASLIAKQPKDFGERMREAIENRDFGALEKLNPNSAVTRESKLFAALLIHESCPDYDPVTHSSHSESGPHVFWETINAFKKLTGREPDGFVVDGLLEVGREVGAMGDEVLQAFLERNRGGASLN